MLTFAFQFGCVILEEANREADSKKGIAHCFSYRKLLSNGPAFNILHYFWHSSLPKFACLSFIKFQLEDFLFVMSTPCLDRERISILNTHCVNAV